MNWRWSYFTAVMLDWFLSELLPIVIFFSKSWKSYLINSSCSVLWFWSSRPVNQYCSHDQKRIILSKRSCSIRVMTLCHFQPFSQQKFLSPQLLLQFSRNFIETFQLLLPWSEDNHIKIRMCAARYYQSYCPLSFFNNNLVSSSSHAAFIGFWSSLPVIVLMTIIYLGLAWLLISRIIAFVGFSHYNNRNAHCFLPELWPFVRFSHFNNRNSCHCNSQWQGWQKGGKYSYFPGRREILVIPGNYW